MEFNGTSTKKNRFQMSFDFTEWPTHWTYRLVVDCYHWDKWIKCTQWNIFYEKKESKVTNGFQWRYQTSNSLHNMKWVRYFDNNSECLLWWLWILRLQVTVNILSFRFHFVSFSISVWFIEFDQRQHNQPIHSPHTIFFWLFVDINGKTWRHTGPS